jgi:hypothetical protein
MLKSVFQMFKLRLYKFLGRFSSYFKRNHRKMSFNQIEKNVKDALVTLNYNNVYRHVASESASHRTFSVEFKVLLHNEDIEIVIRLDFNENSGTEINYRVPKYSSFNVAQEFHNINTLMNRIEPQLQQIFLQM